MIISIGSINIDFQMRIDAAPGSAETLVAHDFTQLPGGKASNVAYLARRLGLEARLIGMIGDDVLACQAIGPLRKAGVDVSGVRVARGCATAVSTIAVPANGKKQIVLALNANDRWSAADLAALDSAMDTAPNDAVVVVDFEIAPSAASRALAAAARRGLLTVVDPSLPAPAQEARRLGAFDAIRALTPNEEEAAGMTGKPIRNLADAAAAARTLLGAHGRGPHMVCVKRADGGCVLASRLTLLSISPTPVDVVDTTGAGDAFTGALAVALFERQPPLEAVLFAMAASHLSVSRYGSQPAYPHRCELAPLISALRSHVEPLEFHG